MEEYDGTRLRTLADYRVETMSTIYVLGTQMHTYTHVNCIFVYVYSYVVRLCLCEGRVLGGGGADDDAVQLLVKGTDGKTHTYRYTHIHTQL